MPGASMASRPSRLGLAGNLVLNAAWDVDAGDQLRASAAACNAPAATQHPRRRPGRAHRGAQQRPGEPARYRRRAARPPACARPRLTLSADGDALRAQLAWDSERAGRVQAEGQTRLSHGAGGWAWPEDAPLAASVRMSCPTWACGPRWRRPAGVWAAATDARLSGTRAAPRWAGSSRPTSLAMRSLLDGVDTA
jgi:translocation and assembly module TamB